MELFKNYVAQVNDFVWGPVMLILILGTGLYLMLGLRLIPLRRIGFAFVMLWRGRSMTGKGDITSFNALMTALSATVGVGNIAGVATAVHLGGPGAIFWMWCTALVGMATKYAESVCAIEYRETDEVGNHVGGPMYYIKNGLGPQWVWLGITFAIFGALAGFGIGNMVQANTVAQALYNSYHIPVAITGIVAAVLAGLVLIGGIRRLGEVSGKLVPLMALIYILGGLVVLILNFSQIPQAFALIFTHAFTPIAATGGFAGAVVAAAIQYGVARGIFSNEAGLGSAPIAHATASTNHSIEQGVIGMLGTFIDTLIVCTVTGLVIVISGTWTSGETGAALSSMAFEQTLPGLGSHLVTISLILFAFTTILGWSFYSEKCVQFLFGIQAVIYYRWLWIIAIPIGAIAELKLIWLVADTLNALMAIPNLIALLLLSPVVFRLTREYFASEKNVKL